MQLFFPREIRVLKRGPSCSTHSRYRKISIIVAIRNKKHEPRVAAREDKRGRVKREGTEGEEGGEGRGINRGTIGENAIRNSTSLARQTPSPPPRCPRARSSLSQPLLTPLSEIPVPPRAALASLVDEFRVCCQSLFRAIISQHFDMTYKPAGKGWVTGYQHEGGRGGGHDREQGQGQRRGCIREVKTGVRRGRGRRTAGGRRYHRAHGYWRVYSR